MIKKKSLFLALMLTVINATPAHALSFGDIIDSTKKIINKESDSTRDSEQSPATSSAASPRPNNNTGESRIAIGFSPEGSAQNAILDFINSAQSEIRLAAYSFTSIEIVKALIKAKRRGVDVKLVVDEKGNVSKHSVAAMNLIVNAKIPIKTISKYAIHHDKFIVVDRASVETGSFNYSSSANSRNSENAIVLYNMPGVAAQYLNHWNSRWHDGTMWRSSY